ncbi:hypothetical protein [Acidiphilium rubrum]|uniref:Uncharacterized protein n=1 Tax=Acidiphilium rubrum TaxID=526 RepID=A0A8G2FCE5_ACIRU|nr:hypothetical protein [Acidiphilium rubrum]SIQ31988.1 hypothetical protein SAMN05421828_103184 [Acidiphilium rubrum]
MAAKKRYYSDDDHVGKTPSALRRLSRTQQRDYLLYWFHRNFEDPAEKTPHESAEGGYQYIWGGPYDASEELSGEFGDIVSEDLLSKVVKEVQSDGTTDWAPGPAHPDMQHRQEDAEGDEVERSQELPRRWQTQGVIIAPLTVGEAVGKPLGEPAHITPRFPRGIKDSDLRQAGGAIQRETAIWWFILNLEPYDHSRAAARFGESRFGDPFNRAAVQAERILHQEFGSVLPDAMIEELGVILAGDWMWKSPPMQLPLAPPSTAAEAITAIVPVLESLAAAVHDLAPPAAHGRIGHNGPPDECAITEQDREEVLEKIKEAKEAAQSNEAEAASKLATLWRQIKEKLDGLGQWTLDRINDFTSEASKEAGKTVGKWLPHYLALHATTYMLVKAADQIIAVLHQH